MKLNLAEGQRTLQKASTAVQIGGRRLQSVENHLGNSEDSRETGDSEVNIETLSKNLSGSELRIWNSLTDEKKKEIVTKSTYMANQTFMGDSNHELKGQIKKESLSVNSTVKNKSKSNGTVRKLIGKHMGKKEAANSSVVAVTKVGTATGGKISAMAATGTATGGASVAVSIGEAGLKGVKEAIQHKQLVDIQNLKAMQQTYLTKYQEGSQSGMATVALLVVTQLAVIGVQLVSMLLSLLLPLLIVITIITSITAVLSLIFGVTSQGSSYPGYNIVTVAEYELETQTGIRGGQRYKEWYGMDADWCAMFLSYVAEQCGYNEAGITPKSASVRNMRMWFEERGLYQTKESGYEPQKGDYIIFENGMSHVGLVVDYNPETKRITTIEGNAGQSSANPYHKGSGVEKSIYSLHTSVISGYGTPKYPMTSPELVGATIEEQVYNYFRASGFSHAATCGIMGNLYQESGLDPSRVQTGSGHAAGIAQWESYKNKSGRWKNLENKAIEQGKEWTDLKIQLDFIVWELQGGDRTTQAILNRDYGGLENFMAATDVAWAVEVFENSFERAGTPNMTNRIAKAKEYDIKYR